MSAALQPRAATLLRPAVVVKARLRDLPMGAAFRTSITRRRGIVCFHFEWTPSVSVKFKDTGDLHELHEDVVVEVAAPRV